MGMTSHNIIQYVELILWAQHVDKEIRKKSTKIHDIVELYVWNWIMVVCSQHMWLNPIEA